MKEEEEWRRLLGRVHRKMQNPLVHVVHPVRLPNALHVLLHLLLLLRPLPVVLALPM